MTVPSGHEKRDARRRWSVAAFYVAALVTVLGVAWTTPALMAWRQSAQIQGGPRTLGVVVALGTVTHGTQQVTLRYHDRAGVQHEVRVGFPLGLESDAALGEATTVVYDAAAPQLAELPGHPSADVQDDWRRAGLTGLVAAVSLLLGAVLMLLRTSTPVPGPQHALPELPPPPARTSQPGLPLLLTSCFALLLASLAVGESLVPPVIAPFPPPPPPLVAGGPAQVPGALSAVAPLSGPLITPAGAREVVRALWPVRDVALANRDLATVEAIEEGPALQVDVARMADGNPPNRAFPQATSVPLFGVFVPRQTAWPAYFVVEVVTVAGGDPWLEVMVFVRRAPTSPWRVTIDTGVGAGGSYHPHLDTPVTDGEGFDVVPDHAWVAASALVPALARYWQSWTDEGAAPLADPPFADMYWTTGYGHELANKQDAPDRNGLNAHFVLGVPPSQPADVWQAGMDGNLTLVCSVLEETVAWQGPTEQDSGRQQWGLDLAPGYYRSVTSTIVREPCFLVRPTKGPVQVIGADRWVVGTVGVRA